MTESETLELSRARLIRLTKEDRFARQELTQPTFTIDELARMSKTPKKDLLKWVMEANLGRATKRDGRHVRVLKLNELRELAREFKWV